MEVPYGLEGIEKVFGKVPRNREERRYWELDNLSKFFFIEPIKYSYGDFFVNRMLVHKKLYNIFMDVFYELYDLNALDLIKDFGGSYVYRRKRNGKELSTHSWGIAIDINCIDNLYGEKPNQPELLVNVFEKYGFVWGGRWNIPDGMHFQFARGY